MPWLFPFNFQAGSGDCVLSLDSEASFLSYLLWTYHLSLKPCRLVN